MSRIYKVLATLLCAAVSLGSGIFVNPAVNAAGVPLNFTYFPDANFLYYICTEFDIDEDGNLDASELDAITSIDISGKDVSDLTGIENFQLLKEIKFSWNPLTTVDLSNNLYLENIECYCTSITSLDLSYNTNLKSLDCSYNKITSLDLSNNTKLTKLRCPGTDITTLDLSKNTKLKELDVAQLTLSSLNISACAELESLNCSNCGLTSINLSGNTKLEYLICSDNNITSIDLSKNSILKCVRLENNNLTKLDVSMLPELRTLTCSFNQISEIDCSNNTNLRYFECEGNKLTSLNIINNNYLLYVYLYSENVNEYKHNGVDVISYSVPYDEITDDVLKTNKSVEIITEITPESTPTPTPELGIGEFVKRCYQVALEREADAKGYTYWCDLLNNSEACGAQVGFGFIFSEEYINKKRSDENYVKDLYKMYFDREPDTAGFNYWLGKLKNGESRENIFAGFANSEEFYNLCTKYNVVQGYYVVGMDNQAQGGVNCFVARFYQIYLGRLPDMAGQSGWVTKLISGEVTGTLCASGFVFSPEYTTNRHWDEEFVAGMYRAFFGREADETGYLAWVQKLSDGMTREEVFAGFAGSPEFYNLCAEYSINP